MMGWADAVTLCGGGVRLELLDRRHHDQLVESTRDGRLWELWYTSVPAPEAMADEISRRLELYRRRLMVPFAVIDQASGGAVGMTTYMNIDATNRRLEIGSTWYRESVWRSGLNTRCKLLLLSHAFETMDCIAVEFRTHFFNRRSRTAIERLGAKLDGVLRSHQVLADGTLRDTCVYSIIAAEWPTVKTHLTFEANWAGDGSTDGSVLG
ncbi:GNAT family N-acetyltransferase [Stieleria mannarensis]|uniref:GNAT family N-acetyltransferase n=1 Tax=Stieleria mannarensis TaxID=2755585 RepID=UPI001C729CF1|nr:GNAT family protein [Rhodopirellula sp. JC639]